MNITGGYIRISIKDQSKYSIDSQEREIRNYCLRYNLMLAGIFVDDGGPSYTFDRKGFKKLEEWIKTTRVNYLIVMEWDRFSRDTSGADLKFKELEKKYNIKVLSQNDPPDTDFSDPTAWLTRNFKLMMGEYELHRIRQRTKSGMLQAALNGRYVNKAPYGYINSKDDSNRPMLVIDEEKAFIIRVIFKEYNRGTNVFDIREIVKPYGYTQKGRSAITRILSNPVYAGLLKIPAHKGAPESIGKAVHPGIVSEADYYSAQRRLNGYKRKGVTLNENVPLKGVIKCHECGNYLSAGNSKSKTGKYHWYYLCSKHRENFPATALHRQMNDILDLFSFEQERIDWYVEKLTQEITNLFNSKAEIIASTQKALRTVNDHIEAIDEKYLTEPNISKATYNRSISKLRSKQIELQKRLAELDTDQDVYWEKLKELMPKLHDIRGSYETMDYYSKQQFLNLSFNQSLTYKNGMFRTQDLHPIFSHNADRLQELGLLEIENGTGISTQVPFVHRRGLYSNPDPSDDYIGTLLQLADIFLAA